MSARPDTASVQRTLSRLTDAIAEAKSNDAVFVAIADAAHVVIGHKLFTVMAFDADAMEVSRVYSSNAQAYPPGGRKKKRDTAWGRQVLERGEPYIGYTADDIRANFNDYEVILGLGLQSVLNMPVRYKGKTLGTMNLLHEFDFYSAKDIEVAALLVEMLVSSLRGEAGFQGDRT